MDGAALAVERPIWPNSGGNAVTPPKSDVQRELGELASELASSIAIHREAHDRLRATLDANEAKLNTIGDVLNGLQRDFAAWKATPPEATKLRFTAPVTYSIVVTVLLLGVGGATVYQAQQTAIHDMAIKIETREKVEAAEQRLRDFKEAKEVADLDRIEKLSQLNAAYITSLQRDQQKR